MQNKQPVWVSNVVANQVVADVQNSLKQNRTDSKSMQTLMDLISGVEKYKLGNHRKQGLIRKIWDRERRNQSSSNSFGLDLDDVISVFWETVFKYLPRAETTGNIVSVRLVEGQHGDAGTTVTKNGVAMTARATKCNPVNYLKHMGITGIRNMLNKSYRKHIIQVCGACGNSSSVMSVEEHASSCPSCKSANTEKYWPSGNSSYKSRKGRRCLDCHHAWDRRFNRQCFRCGSDDVHTDAMVINQDDTMFQQADDSDTAEQTLVANEVENEMSKLLDAIYKSLPTDPKNPAVATRTHDVFNLLTRPEASKDMCKQCVFKAPKVCEKKCDVFKKMKMCEHDLIPDPNISCGGESMFAAKCVNYSKKIGEWHGVSASLASRRVKKVRQYVSRYVMANKTHPAYDTLHKLLVKHEVL